MRHVGLTVRAQDIRDHRVPGQLLGPAIPGPVAQVVAAEGHRDAAMVNPPVISDRSRAFTGPRMTDNAGPRRRAAEDDASGPVGRFVRSLEVAYLADPDEDLGAQVRGRRVAAAVLDHYALDCVFQAVLAQTGPALVEVLAHLRSVGLVQLFV